MSDIQEKLEQIINNLAISNEMEKYLKEQINFFFSFLQRFDKHRTISRSFFPSPDASDLSSSNYFLDRFYYGGSFDRGIYINKKFDIDIYLVFKGGDRFTSQDERQKIESVSGKILFEFLNLRIKPGDYGWQILKEPPYFHAIPIQLMHLDQKDVIGPIMTYNSVKLEKEKESEQYLKIFVDCVPSIETPDNYLIIPNGEKANKKVNPKLEEEALSRLNKKSNGKATKLIRLIKAWNHHVKNPLRSYLIERLVEKIFENREITDWTSSLLTFFDQASYILKTNDIIPDRVYNQNSILDDYSQDQKENFYNAINQASLHAHEGEWEQLLGTIKHV